MSKSFWHNIFLVFLIFSFSIACQKNDLLNANVIAPVNPQPDYNEYGELVFIPSPLTISFESGGVSPAEISLYNKVIKKGITITPAIDGEWIWSSEYTLIFKPFKDWLPDSNYQVSISPEVFNKALPKKKRSYTFKTEAFEANIEDYVLSRAPEEKSTPRFIVTVAFSTPIDKGSFEKAITLTIDNEKLPFQVEYNDKERKAYIKSSPINLLENSRKVLFKATNFFPENSKLKYEKELRVAETVPDYGNFFYITAVSAKVIKDGESSPQQVVTIEFTDEVSSKDVADNIEIYLIEKNKISRNNLEEFNEYGTFLISPSIIKSNSEYLKKIKAKLIDSADNFSEYHSFVVDIEDADKYNLIVVFDKPIKSATGFPLKKYAYVLTNAPEYPVELYINNDGAILQRYGENILTLSSRGLNYVQVEIGRLTDNQLQHIISYTQSGGFDAEFKSGMIDENNLAYFETKTIKLNSESKKDIAYASIDLNEYTKSNSSFFIIKATGLDINKKKRSETIMKTILVTDIALINKRNVHGAYDIFALSISKKEPVANAIINVIGKNGRSIFETRTNENGYASIRSLNDFKNEKYPLAIVATKGNDYSFIPLNNYNHVVDYSRFDIGGSYFSNSTNGLSAFLFSDRGIYRPGEIVKVAGIVKQPDWRALGGVPIQIVITGPDSSQALVRSFTLNDEGFFNLDFATEKTSRTGIYYVEAYLMKDDRRSAMIGHTSFSLDEYEADTMRVKLKILNKSSKGWIYPDNVSAYLKAENMYGTPAEARRISWSGFTEPYVFSFKEYKDYNFTDPNIDRKSVLRNRAELKISDSSTNKEGESFTDIDISSLLHGTYRLILKGNVYEAESGDSVAASDYALISPLSYIAGYKPSTNLNFIKRNSKQSVEFIAINNELSKIDVENITLRLIKVENIRSLVKGNDGAYRYISVEKRNIVREDGGFKISSKGTQYPIETNVAGKYVIELVDDKGILLSSVRYFVAGEVNVNMAVDKNAELSVTLNKNKYAPGEEMELNIISPYSGVGLITIERERCYYYEWFNTESNSSVVKLKVPNNIEGSAYINISFMRDPKSKEVFISPYSYAAVPFEVQASKRNINLKIEAPDNVRPNEELIIKYSADQDSKIILYGVDEGILQVAEYSVPNPLAYFFMKRALEVHTSQTIALVLPDYSVIRSAAGIGGGEMEAMMLAAVGQNPFSRKVPAPTVFNSGILEVKAGKSYEYKYTPPYYFNGSLKIMAVAASVSAVGSLSADVIVRSPIIMTPNAPFAVTVSDTFDMPVGVANNIETNDAESSITISAKPSEHLEIIGERAQTITIPKGAERTLIFKVKALDTLGAANVALTAESKSVSNVLAEATLSVRPATAYEERLTVGMSSTPKFVIKGVFRDMYDGLAKRTIGAAASPSIILEGLHGFLVDYPHDCTEQLVSGAFPRLYLGADKDSIKQLFDKLRGRQRNDGGFSYWNDGGNSDIFVSIYTMHFLIEAKEHGLPVPSGMIEKGLNILNGVSFAEAENLYDAQLQAYATYLLARNGIVVTRNINRLEESFNSLFPDKWQETLAGAYIGAAYIIMQNNEKGDALMLRFKPEGEKYLFYSDFDSSSNRNAQYLYLATKHFNRVLPIFKELSQKIMKNISEGNISTINSSYAIMALASYGNDFDNSKAEFVSVDDRGVKSTLENAEFKNGIKEVGVSISTKSEVGYFYYVLQNGYDKALPKKISAGIEITKEYLDKAGNEISEASQGDVITVRIRLRKTDLKEFISNIVITDLLPGGFEIVRGSVSTGGNEWFVQSYDIREDRVLFYTSLYSPDIQEITYLVKPLNIGEFKAPSVYAESMYDKSVRSNSESGVFKVKK